MKSLDETISTDQDFDNDTGLIPKLDTSKILPPKEILSDNNEYMPIAVAIEKLLFDLINTILYVSLVQVFIFCVGILCWLESHHTYAVLLLFFPHMISGIVGIIIHQNFPKNLHIVNRI